VESFGSRPRDELLAVAAFSSLLEARVLIEDWRIEYNAIRPYGALGYLTPTDYANTWTTNTQHSHSAWTNTSVRSRPHKN
jgi:putative transposase